MTIAAWDALVSVHNHVSQVAVASPPVDSLLTELECKATCQGSTGRVRLYGKKGSRATVAVKFPRKPSRCAAQNACSLLAEIAIHRAAQKRMHGTWAASILPEFLACERTSRTQHAAPPEYRVAYEAIDGGGEAQGVSMQTFLTRRTEAGGYKSEFELGVVLVQFGCVVQLLLEQFGFVHGDLSATNVYVYREAKGDKNVYVRMIDCGWTQLAITRDPATRTWIDMVGTTINKDLDVGWVGTQQLAYTCKQRWKRAYGMSDAKKIKKVRRAVGLDSAKKTPFRSGHCCESASTETIVSREMGIFWGHVACLPYERALPRQDCADMVWQQDHAKVRDVLFRQLAAAYKPDKDGLYRALFLFKDGRDIAQLDMSMLSGKATAKCGLRLLRERSQADDSEVWVQQWKECGGVPIRLQEQCTNLLSSWFV